MCCNHSEWWKWMNLHSLKILEYGNDFLHFHIVIWRYIFYFCFWCVCVFFFGVTSISNRIANWNERVWIWARRSNTISKSDTEMLMSFEMRWRHTRYIRLIHSSAPIQYMYGIHRNRTKICIKCKLYNELQVDDASIDFLTGPIMNINILTLVKIEYDIHQQYSVFINIYINISLSKW